MTVGDRASIAMVSFLICLRGVLVEFQGGNFFNEF